MTVSSGGFELQGNDGDETRLLMHPGRGYSIALPGRVQVAAAPMQGPRYDIVLKMTDAVVELGFRMDDVPTEILAQNLVPTSAATYAYNRARNPRSVAVKTLMGRTLPRGANRGVYTNYELDSTDDEAMEFLMVVGRNASPGIVHELYVTARFRKSEMTPFAWSNLRPALLNHHSWTPSEPPAMQIWPERCLYAVPSVRFRLTPSALAEAEAKAHDVGHVDEKNIETLADFLIESTNVQLPPADPYDVSEFMTELASRVPPRLAQVLLRDISSVTTVHDFRGWLWECYCGVGNRDEVSNVKQATSQQLDSLSDAVINNPEPDAPRTEYARAVRPIDPDRASLIETQIAITASFRARRPGIERRELFAQEDLLLTRNKERWTSNVMALGWIDRAYMLRGFVESVRVSARDFLDGAEHLYAIAPILHVDFIDAKPLMQKLVASRFIERLHSLGFLLNGLDDDDVAALAGSPLVANVRRLDLNRNRIGLRGLEALCSSPHLKSLRYLGFSQNQVSDPTPQIAETDPITQRVLQIATPALGQELMRRFGSKAWLTADGSPDEYPLPKGAL